MRFEKMDAGASTEIGPDADAAALRCPDPNLPDRAGEVVIRSTETRMWRLVLAAMETGARFAREGGGTDPIEWFAEPRSIFGGRSAFEACQELKHFQRVILLHGLGLDDEVDAAALVRSRGPSVQDPTDDGATSPTRPVLRLLPGGLDQAASALWSSVFDDEGRGLRTQVFWAMVARDAEEVRGRIAMIYGPRAADEAIVSPGFDWSEPMENAMVSGAMAHTLRLAAEEPGSDFAAALELRIEQRFRS